MTPADAPFTFRPPIRRKTSRLWLGAILSLIAIGAGIVTAAVVWLPRTLEYAVADGRLTVISGVALRPTIATVALADIERSSPIRLRKGTRVAGTALPGYCCGSFRFPDLGRVRLATDCSADAVVLEVRGWDRLWVLTPGNRDGFLGALAGEGIYSERFHTGGGGAVWNTLKILVLVAVAAALLVPLVFFVSPTRLRYRVAPGRLEVDTTLGTRSITIDTCLARIYAPESSTKVWGTSMPGFYSGRFTVDGMATRVYATRLDRGVLIEGPDLRLFLSPEEPHAFLECLRARGGIPVE